MSMVPKISCNIILIQHNVLEKITNIDIKKERLVALTAYSLLINPFRANMSTNKALEILIKDCKALQS